MRTTHNYLENIGNGERTLSVPMVRVFVWLVSSQILTIYVTAVLRKCWCGVGRKQLHGFVWSFEPQSHVSFCAGVQPNASPENLPGLALVGEANQGCFIISCARRPRWCCNNPAIRDDDKICKAAHSFDPSLDSLSLSWG